ncbi:unnamed protein product [Cylicocyclus nassatus]|uniref:Peptidase M13 C-terminal domain-containing protein n=1 Tax=Cylicocyclus nassatus TaxID=53992 RepID=A0AA36H2U6_CYLNA|nr:unnamed protein product [Cylicocyclus nassatus]
MNLMQKMYRKHFERLGYNFLMKSTKQENFADTQGILLAYKYWCRPEEVNEIAYDATHAPKELRVNIPLTNLAEFAEAFHCSPGSPMNSAVRRQRIFL